MKTINETKEMLLPSALVGEPMPTQAGEPAPTTAKEDDKTKILIWLAVVLIGGVLAGKYLWK